MDSVNDERAIFSVNLQNIWNMGFMGGGHGSRHIKAIL